MRGYKRERVYRLEMYIPVSQNTNKQYPMTGQTFTVLVKPDTSSRRVLSVASKLVYFVLSSSKAMSFSAISARENKCVQLETVRRNQERDWDSPASIIREQ